MSFFRLGAIQFCAVLMLSACVGNGLIPERFRSSQAVQSRSAPAADRTLNTEGQPVEASAMPAETGGNSSTPATDSELEQEAATAKSAITIGRADLLGGWKVKTGNDNCQLFMSLTGWAGGYRAITKGCSSESLTGVQAWNLTGKEITLVSGSGDTVVRLAAIEKTRLSGTTNDNLAVIATR